MMQRKEEEGNTGGCQKRKPREKMMFSDPVSATDGCQDAIDAEDDR